MSTRGAAGAQPPIRAQGAVSCHSWSVWAALGATRWLVPGGGEVPEAWWGWWGQRAQLRAAGGARSFSVPAASWKHRLAGQEPSVLGSSPPPLPSWRCLLILGKEGKKTETESEPSPKHSPKQPVPSPSAEPSGHPSSGSIAPFPNCCPASPPAGASWGLGRLRCRAVGDALLTGRLAGEGRGACGPHQGLAQHS